MPPRPSLHSLLLMAASASSSAAASGGLLLAARRRLAAMAAADGHRIRLLHSFAPGRVPRWPEVACCLRGTRDARRSPPTSAHLLSRNGNIGNYFRRSYKCDKEPLNNERVNSLTPLPSMDHLDHNCGRSPLKDLTNTVTNGDQSAFNTQAKVDEAKQRRREREKARRDAMTQEERQHERERNKARRDAMTQEQRQRKRERDKARRDAMSQEERQRNRERDKARRDAMTQEERQRKRERDKARWDAMTQEERDEKNKKCRQARQLRKSKTSLAGGSRDEVELDKADGVTNISQGKTDIESETDQEVEAKKTANKVYRKVIEEDLNLEPLWDELVEYFSMRMISAETLGRNKVMQRNCNNKISIAFTYRRDGVLVGCKYRTADKTFSQEANTENFFYGLDDIKHAHDIIIVEGEIDKLSMDEAGYRNCVSVPDGAPPKVSSKIPDKEQDKKYNYLWNCKDYLDSASRIILATDDDLPGQALAEELARRLGKERCWRVKWPKKNATDTCKDANEVLMFLGPQALRKVIEDAELYPIRGLFSFKDFFRETDNYFLGIHGDEHGIHTGWKSLDDLYKVVPGELTVVTGVPNSGKSEWIDALLCNLNKQCGWKFVLCSMENKVKEHARKLLEKHIEKPLFDARYGESAPRMAPDEFELGKQWLNETFHLIRYEDDSLPSINWILDLAKAAVLRHGVRGLVIDPYNELDHQRPSNQTETEYVSQILTKVKRFAQYHSCHVWFVAHPRQLHNWNGGPPNMYDISGSAHFINKCDNGIVVHRNRDPNAGPLDVVQVCVRKVRNKVIGQIGDAFLTYDRVTGQYKDAGKPTTAAITAV